VRIHGEVGRWPGLGRGAGQRNFSSENHEPTQCGLGLPIKGLAAVSLNLSSLGQS